MTTTLTAWAKACPVSPILWRSGQPIGDEWRVLHEMGVKCVLKLNEAGNWPDEALDLRVIHAPLDTRETTPDAAALPEEKLVMVDAALDFLCSKAVTLVHCSAGVDRTGLIVARYRVRREGWKKADAFAEWVRLGSHGHAALVKSWNAWSPS